MNDETGKYDSKIHLRQMGNLTVTNLFSMQNKVVVVTGGLGAKVLVVLAGGLGAFVLMGPPSPEMAISAQALKWNRNEGLLCTIEPQFM